MRLGSKTLVGKVRASNEDAILVDFPIFAVADGMGGHQAGEIASRRVLEIVNKKLHEQEDLDPSHRIDSALKSANTEIWLEAKAIEGLHGMGTTITLALFNDDEVFIGHIGDSRAYLYSPGGLVQLTQDHSIVGEMIREGRLTEDDARNHPSRNIITKAIGTSSDVNPDLISVKLNPKDKLLLCTDGLTAMLTDAEISEITAQRIDPQQICEELAVKANTLGGIDNISLVLVDFGSGL